MHIWINKFGIRTPIQFLSDKHLMNNLKFLKRKAMKKAFDEDDDEWERYLPRIYYAILDEMESRGVLV